MKIYLSGPMTGLPSFNYPLFNQQAARLRALGHVVANPAEILGGDTTQTRSFYLRKDIQDILLCDAVALLPNWERSKGARLEVSLALELGLALFDALTMLPMETKYLEQVLATRF